MDHFFPAFMKLLYTGATPLQAMEEPQAPQDPEEPEPSPRARFELN